MKFPRGQGPKVDLLEPTALGKALATVAARLGRNLKASELMVSEDEIAITARDPKKPDSLGAFAYRDQEIERDTGARAMIANSMGFGPGALFDLASLEPAVSGPLAAMQRETLSRLKVPNGRVIRLTFSKDRAFRPDNDKVLVEVRVAGDGPDHQWIDYELSGKVAATDNMVKSGIRVVRPVSRRDEEDCTRSSEPATVIAACTRLIESGQFTARNLAIFHYDRGIAHKNKKDFDQALNDYSEAIRLDPNYAHAYLNRGVLLADKRELDRAMVDFAAAIRLDPKEKLGYMNRAAAYKIKGDWDRAIADYSEAIRLDPNDIKSLRPRHRLFVKAGLRPRDRRFRRGHSAGAQSRRGVHPARTLPSGEGRFRAGHRRLYRGDPADAARSRALYRSRLGLSLCRRSRPRDRRLHRGARDRPEIGARLSKSRLVLSRQRRVRPRPCRLRPGASARSQECAR